MARSRRPPLPAPERLLRTVVRRVLAWEGAPGARVTLTLLPPARMKTLNRRTFGRRALTDVIAFPLPQPDGSLLGDVYLCPAAARAWARSEGGGPDAYRQEMIRLAVHGTLHVLGYDHPGGVGRTRSRMWRTQERYVRRLTGDA
jgi:probable rRNA maturation factor